MQNVFFQKTGFEPFLKHGLFHWNMGQEPFVRDRVETAFDVAF
jgi:hypothetical protein